MIIQMAVEQIASSHLEDYLQLLVGQIRPFNYELGVKAAKLHSTLAKPPGSLGKLEEVASRLAGITGRVPPKVPNKPYLIVSAADHGVTTHRVTTAKTSMTEVVAKNLCRGQSVANAIARRVGVTVLILDVGVAGDIPKYPLLITKKVRRGTADFSVRPAMLRSEVLQAIFEGIQVANRLIARGCDLILIGEVGVGNTVSASALISTFTACETRTAVDLGFGLEDKVSQTKMELVQQALEVHAPNPRDSLDVLAKIGGLEIASMVGIMAACAAHRIPCVLDGMIAIAAALAANALQPDITQFLLASTLSPEPGAKHALDYLHLEPILDLNMRLGEGSASLLATPIIQSSAHVMNEVVHYREHELG